MLKSERHQIILKEVEKRNRVQLQDLVQRLNVSIDTVRRDVKELDGEHKLRKVHGGAVSLGFASFSPQRNSIYALEAKTHIAEKAIGMVSEGQVIFLDGGTTCLEMARSLPAEWELKVFTHSIPVALELLQKPRYTVEFIGGTLSPESHLAQGIAAVRQLAELHLDLAFIGTGYVDAEHGLSESVWETAQMKKSLIEAARKTVLLCISEKVNSQHRFRSCSLDRIATLITEKDPGDSELKNFQNLQLDLR
jgi:DeoR/GlpR family transcriptional regulator of sugar metabolism